MPDHQRPLSDHPVYAISVAAELAGLAVPTLRLYEQHGLVLPSRTSGGTRRYSEHDIARIRRISELVDGGVTLSAVRMVLDLQDDNERLREEAATRDRAGAPRSRQRSGTGRSARRRTGS